MRIVADHRVSGVLLASLIALSAAGAEEGAASEDLKAAVTAGLKWLARNQSEAGNWEIKRWGGRHAEEATVGVTGLAVLAFVRARHTERSGPFKETVAKALEYLVSQQTGNGCIGENRSGEKRSSWTGGGGYNHAIAGLALAEAYVASRSPRLRSAASRAADYSTNVHQARDGGWRYGPGTPHSDTCVTGWFVTQLKTAMSAGIYVNREALPRVRGFLDKVTELKTGRACYWDPAYQGGPFSRPTPPMTAVATYTSQILGRYSRNAPVLSRVADYLLRHPPGWESNKEEVYLSRDDFYYWYYGTLVMSRIGGERWKSWKAGLHALLLRSQLRTARDRKLNGSWEPNGYSAWRGGRACATAMACLILEIRESRKKTGG